MAELAVVILAAGQGTRMKSALPKVLHPLGGKPLVCYSIEAATEVSGRPPVLVVGFGAEQVRQVVGSAADYVTQERQLGTAHAVQQTFTVLAGTIEYVLVCYADMPLITAATLRRLAETQTRNKGPITLLTVVADDPRGFGRIVRRPNGEVAAIVEEAQCSPEQLMIRELNAGLYCFRADWLWPHLLRVEPSPKGEYYLTDLVGLAAREEQSVCALPVGDPDEVLGINSRVHLAEAESILRRRITRRWMEAGVTMIDPTSVYISSGVDIGADTVVWPNSYLQGDTRIGSGCQLGPNVIIRDSVLGDGCRVWQAVVERENLEAGSAVGPFVHLQGNREGRCTSARAEDREF